MDTFVAGEAVIVWKSDFSALKKSGQQVETISNAAGKRASAAFKSGYNGKSLGKAVADDLNAGLSAVKIGKQIEKNFKQGGTAASLAMNKLVIDAKKAIAKFSATEAVGEAAKLADAWTAATNEIEAAEQVFGSSLGSISDVTGIANATRSELSVTVELYSGLAAAGGVLGRSQTDVARTTELLNKAFKAGGASAEEQSKAISKLSSSLKSGLFSGADIQTISAQAPLIAQSIAETLGVATAELIKLGDAGQVTSKIIFDSLAGSAKTIEAQYAQTIPTIADSFNVLKNKATEYVGTLSQTIGGTAALTKFIEVVAENFELLADAAVVAAFAIGGSFAGQAMVAFIVKMKTANLLMIGARGNMAGMAAASALASKAVAGLSRALAFAGGPVTLLLGGIALAVLAIHKESKKAAEQQERYNQTIDKARQLNEKYKPLIDGVTTGLGNQTTKVQALAKEYKNLAQRAAEAGEAQKLQQITELSRTNNDLLSSRFEKEDRIKEIRDKTQTRKFGSNYPQELEEIRRLEKEILEINSEREALLASANAIRLQKPEDTDVGREITENGVNLSRQLRDENELKRARVRNDQAEIDRHNDKKLLLEQIDKFDEAGSIDPENDARKFVTQFQKDRAIGRSSKSASSVSTASDLPNEVTSSNDTPNLNAEIVAAQLAEQERGTRERIADLKDRELDIEIEAAGLRRDDKEVERLSREIELRERVADLKQLGLSDDDATKKASEEQGQLDTARAIQAEAAAVQKLTDDLILKNEEEIRGLEIKSELARLAIDTTEAERLERSIELLREKNGLLADGKSETDADIGAKKSQEDRDNANAEGELRSTFKSTFKAALDGDFESFLSNKLKNAAANMFDNALDGLFNALLEGLGGVDGAFGEF